jgi:methionine-rich copper-binding protein CopC
VATLLLLLFLTSFSGSLFAHAELKQGKPSPGAQLTEPPDEIRLIFNETLGPGSTFDLFDKEFRRISDVNPHIDPQAPDQLWARLPDLEPGKYTIQWMVKGADGHPSSASYAFQVVTPAKSNQAKQLFPIGAIIIVAILAAYLLRKGYLRQRRPWGGS